MGCPTRLHCVQAFTDFRAPALGAGSGLAFTLLDRRLRAAEQLAAVQVFFSSSTGTWSASLRWIDSMRPIITPRAYSGFCLGVVGSRAAKQGAYAAFSDLLAPVIENDGNF